MGTKKVNGKAWLSVDEPVRARLNLYKMVLGITDSGITDQSATITALLDRANAPSRPEDLMHHVAQPGAVTQ